MGNEDWILYNNGEERRPWGQRNESSLATAKTGLHPKKVIYIQCYWKGVFYEKWQKVVEQNCEYTEK